jgi:hypothetical protein
MIPGVIEEDNEVEKSPPDARSGAPEQTSV